MRRVLLVMMIVGVSACANNSPTAPTAPAAPACQTNHTGTVTFTNRGSRTIDVLWNGSVAVTLAAGQTSNAQTVVAGGAQYVFDAVLTNTAIHPCATLVATPLQCQTSTYSTCVF